MDTPRITISLGRSLLLAIGCAAVIPAFAAEFHPSPCRPADYSRMARNSFQAAMATQAGNGRVLSQTIWNYHFKPETADLHPMGIAHLNRLVRRGWREPLELFVETSHDLRFDPGAAAEYVKARDALDAKRLQAVASYLRIVANRTDVSLLLHDPAPVGMWSDETWRGNKDMVQNAPRGYLTAEAIAKGSVSDDQPGGYPTSLQLDLGGAGHLFAPPPNFGADIPVGDFLDSFPPDF